MSIILIVTLILLLCLYGIQKTNFDNILNPLCFLVAAISGSALFVMLISLPINISDTNSFIKKVERDREYYAEIKDINIDRNTYAKLVHRVIRTNERLRAEKDGDGGIFDIWVPDKIHNVKPIVLE